MSATRLQLEDSPRSAVLKMAGGNPGAITVCIEMLSKGEQIDPDSFCGGFACLLSLDSLGVYEHRIWMLYKDVCKQDLVNTIGVLRANQLGFVSAQALCHGIDNRGAGLDVADLVKQVRERLPRFAVEYEKALAQQVKEKPNASD